MYPSLLSRKVCKVLLTTFYENNGFIGIWWCAVTTLGRYLHLIVCYLFQIAAVSSTLIMDQLSTAKTPPCDGVIFIQSRLGVSFMSQIPVFLTSGSDRQSRCIKLCSSSSDREPSDDHLRQVESRQSFLEFLKCFIFRLRPSLEYGATINCSCHVRYPHLRTCYLFQIAGVSSALMMDQLSLKKTALRRESVCEVLSGY